MLESVVGPWGAKFVSGGVMLSVAGVLLAWTLFTVELPRFAAIDGIFHKVLAKENAPLAVIFAVDHQRLNPDLLILTPLYSAGYQALFSIATAAILPPYLFIAAYGLKLAWTG